MFNYSSFIFSYNSTDKVIRLVDDRGQVAHTISVCAYQKSGVAGNILSIVLEDAHKEIKLEFDSNSSAHMAYGFFKQAIDTLRPNCRAAISPPGGGGTPSATPIDLTYIQFKVLRDNGTLIPRQYYDLTDTTNLLGSSSYVFRVLTSTNHDRQVEAHIVATDVKVVIDVVKDIVTDYSDTSKSNKVVNGNSRDSQFDNSYNNTAINLSSIVALDSDYIVATNGSRVNAASSTMVTANNGSDIKVKDATNVTFDNIQQDLTGIGFMLTNVNIDRNVSKGKGGRSSLVDAAGSLSLESYYDTIEQDIQYSSNNNMLSLALDNNIPQANAEFRIRLTGSGTGNVVVVKDAINNTLYTIRDNDKGNVVIFTYNKAAGLFEIAGIDSFSTTSGKTINVTSITPNQTEFILTYPVTNSAELQMFVNGQKQTVGLDYVYDAAINRVVWAARYFMLMPGDEVEFKVY